MGGGDDVGSPVVVGALILDVHAKPSSTAPISGTTVPGQVGFSYVSLSLLIHFSCAIKYPIMHMIESEGRKTNHKSMILRTSCV